MKRALVTGSGGFIGHWLARDLERRGYWVRGIDLEKPHFSSTDEMDEFFKKDLKDPEVCEFFTRNIDEVYNLAALNGSIELTTNNKAELIHNNALINLNMAEACWKNKVGKVFFSSSACVYPIHYQDSDEVHPLKEEDVDPAHPDTEYGWEKLFSEHVYTSYAQDRGMNIRIARFINIFGPEGLIDTLKSKAPMALTRKVIEAGQGGTVDIWGDGGQKRTFCYITDLLFGIHQLMESDVREPINLGSDVLVSINELVDKIAELEGITVKRRYQMNKVQGVRTRTPDLSKAKRLLNWQPYTSLEDGLLAINGFAHKVLKK